MSYNLLIVEVERGVVAPMGSAKWLGANLSLCGESKAGGVTLGGRAGREKATFELLFSLR